MITLEQVDQLRKRTNCVMKKQKNCEKHDGNVLEAIVDFERSKNTKYNYILLHTIARKTKRFLVKR